MRNKTSTPIKVILFIVALLISIFFAMPFVYMILMSLMKSSNAIFEYPPKLFSGVLQFENYVKTWNSIDMGKLLGNTLIMIASTMVIGIIAYGFSRFKNK